MSNFTTQVLFRHQAQLINTLDLVGFILNRKNSELDLTQDLQFLGIHLRLDLGEDSLPESKAWVIVARARHLSSLQVLTYSQVSQLMGSLNWASGLIPLGRLYPRPLQRHFHSLGLTDMFTPPRRSDPLVLANLLRQWQDLRFSLPQESRSARFRRTLRFSQMPPLRGGCPHGGFPDFGYLDPYRSQAPYQLFGAQGGDFCPTALGSSAPGLPGYGRHGQFDSSFIYQQARRDPLPHLALFDSRSFPLVRGSEYNSSGKAYSRLSERASRPPISSESAHTDRVVPPPRDRGTYLQGLGHTRSRHVFNFVELPPSLSEPRALAVDALSQDWQGRSMYMFSPFPLLNKVIQKLRPTQVAEVVLIAPWWPSQSWFPHLLRLCVEHPLVLPYRRDLLSQQDQKYILDGKSYHLHAWRLSCDTIKQQAFQTRSLGSLQPLRGPQPIACTTICGFAPWAAGQGFDPLDPTAAEIASFFVYSFDTHGLSTQTVKGYRTCLGSV